MSDIEKVGRKALSTLPGPLKRGLDGTNLQFISVPPEHSSRNLPAIASVADNSPDTIQVSDPQRFTQGAPQVLAHEATHLWQNNLPPKLQQMIPPDNPQNPYDFGGTAGLKTMRAQGKRLLDLPREKEASILQHSMVEKDPAYKPWIDDMNSVPLSQIMPTRPGQQGIETTPRPPRPPATMYADQLVGKGSTPPIDYDALAKQNGGNVVPAGTGGPDYNALAQQYGGTVVSDAQSAPAGTPGGVLPKVGALPVPKGLQGSALPNEIIDQGGEVLKGVGKGVLNTAQGVNNLIAPRGSFFNSEPPRNTAPSNTAQSIGKGIEQAGEFMLPGLGEEAATGKIASGLPKIAAKLGYAALTSGAINKAQGGSFGTGAAAGGVGTGIGLGLKAAAPAMAEFAQGINTPGKKAGRAILNETSGILPSSIRRSAQGVLDKLNPELDQAAIRAGQRPPANIAGFLPPPKYQIPLGEAPGLPDMPGALVDAERFPAQNVGEARVIRNARGQILPRTSRKVEFPVSRPPAENPNWVPGYAEGPPEGPGEKPLLPPGRDLKGRMLSRQPTRKAFMSGTGEQMFSAPEIGGPGTIIGDERAARAAGLPFEPPAQEVPYNGISMRPARTIAGEALNRANLQGEPKLVKGVGRLQKQLMNRGEAGSRPEVVSPYEFLQAKRGVGNAVSAAKWKPGYRDPFTGVQKRVYGNMNEAFENAVPEARELNGRISALIPASKPGKLLFGHALGPAAGAILGGTEGARRGGVLGGIEGAAAGGLGGIAAPALINTGARLAYGPGRRLIPLAVGGGLQATRK